MALQNQRSLNYMMLKLKIVRWESFSFFFSRPLTRKFLMTEECVPKHFRRITTSKERKCKRKVREDMWYMDATLESSTDDLVLSKLSVFLDGFQLRQDGGWLSSMNSTRVPLLLLPRLRDLLHRRAGLRVVTVRRMCFFSSLFFCVCLWQFTMCCLDK